MTCNTCEWFVEETETIGNYLHSEAKRLGEGFCLLKDLFTSARASDKSCKNYLRENINEREKRY